MSCLFFFSFVLCEKFCLPFSKSYVKSILAWFAWMTGLRLLRYLTVILLDIILLCNFVSIGQFLSNFTVPRNIWKAILVTWMRESWNGALLRGKVQPYSIDTNAVWLLGYPIVIFLVTTHFNTYCVLPNCYSCDTDVWGR